MIKATAVVHVMMNNGTKAAATTGPTPMDCFSNCSFCSLCFFCFVQCFTAPIGCMSPELCCSPEMLAGVGRGVLVAGEGIGPVYRQLLLVLAGV
jgi:hypothetical protein